MYKKYFPGVIKNKDCVFLDNAGITQKPKVFIDSVVDFYENYVVNNHALDSNIGVKVHDRVAEARELIKKYVNARKEDQVFFTSGASESLNLVISMLKTKLTPNDAVIVSEVDHASNIMPWMRYSKEIGFDLRIVKHKNYVMDIEDLKEKTKDGKVKIISFTHSSNAFGTTTNIEEVNKYKKDAIVVLDTAQTFPHEKIMFEKWDIDFAVFSAGKLYGPSGLGGVIMKKKWMTLEPAKLGGGTQVVFDRKGYTLKENIDRFEAGTINVAGIWAFVESLNFALEIGIENIHKWEKEIFRYAKEEFSKLDNVIVHSPDDAISLVFEVKNVASHDVVSYLGHRNIMLRAGKVCAHIILGDINQAGVIRASFAIYNTKEDIDRLCQTIKNGGDFLNDII